jgi:iron complex outermembrane receptor protein
MNPNVLDIDLNATAAMTSTIIQDQSTWSQEIRFESQEGDNLNWTAGLFYSDDEIEGTATRDIGIGQLMNTTYSLESENLGAFGSIIRNLTDQDDLQLSLRADRYKKSISRTGPALSFPSPTFFPTLTDVSHAFSKNQNSIAGTLSWNHQFSDITSIRSTIGYSEKPGGYSAFSNEATETEFSEEKITSYEVSLKLNPSEGWALTISPFYNEIRDYQFELNGAGLTDYYLENADEVSVYGVEVDSSWLFEGGWAFSASYGLMESEFEKVSALPALNGKQLGFVPSHSLSLLLSHDLENGLSYQIGSRTIGKSYYWNNTGTNSADNIGTYTLIDAGIGYEINDWDLTVFGSNLTDEEYYTSLVSSLGFASAPGIAGSPRVIGLSISREF